MLPFVTTERSAKNSRSWRPTVPPGGSLTRASCGGSYSPEIGFPSVLAQRLAVSESAATRLLEALGYEPAEDELMEFTGSSAGLAARGPWEQGELSEAGYVELEDLLGD